MWHWTRWAAMSIKLAVLIGSPWYTCTYDNFPGCPKQPHLNYWQCVVMKAWTLLVPSYAVYFSVFWEFKVFTWSKFFRMRFSHTIPSPSLRNYYPRKSRTIMPLFFFFSFEQLAGRHRHKQHCLSTRGQDKGVSLCIGWLRPTSEVVIPH